MSLPFAKLVSLVKPKRRWLQFSMGTMLLAVTALCVWLADYVSPVRRLERQLRDPDEEQRELAAERLGYMGHDARSTAKSLLRATDDSSGPVCVRATWALSRVSDRADLLAPLLDHPDDEVRLAAVEGLLWNGGDPVPLVPILLNLSPTVDDNSIFEALGPDQAAAVVPLLLDSLTGEDPAALVDPRDAVANALYHVAMPAPTVVPALIARSNHDRPIVRTAAAEQLLRLGDSAKAAAPVLRAHLHDRDPTCAAACAAAMGAIDPGNREWLGILRRALRSDDKIVGLRVSTYLWMLGPVAADASDDLVHFLCEVQRGAPGVAYFDINAFIRIGPPAVSALDRALQQALIDDERLSAVPKPVFDRLRSFGWAAGERLWRERFKLREARKTTLSVSQNASGRMQTIVLRAKVRLLERAARWASIFAMPEPRVMIPMWLGVLGPQAKPAVPTLIAALNHESFRSSWDALSLIGRDAAPAVPRLLIFLDSDDQFLRRSALQALLQIGVTDETARARLRPFLASRDADERAYAACILAQSGEPVGRILPHLLELAKDPHFGDGAGLPPGEGYSPGIRDALVTSMASLGPAAVPDLIVALESPHAAVRRSATKALGDIGSEASPSVPHLIRLLDDDDGWYSAADALGQIGHEARAAVPKLIELLEAMQAPLEAGEYAGEYASEPDPSDEGEETVEMPPTDDDDQYVADAMDYAPLLSALRGIGASAREASPAVLRLANFDDPQIRHEAVWTLAKIDPDNPSLIGYLRRWLSEWQRESAINNMRIMDVKRQFDKFSDAVWDLGPRAESLASDLECLMATAPLANPKARCYAAFALARFSSHRRAAVDYLEGIRKCGFFESFDSVNLAEDLLQRIAGREPSGPRLFRPMGVGP